MSHDNELVARLESVQNLLVAVAEGDAIDDAKYRMLRRTVMQDPRVGPRMPAFVRDCRDEQQVWDFLVQRWPDDPSERRRFVWEAFRPIIDEIEFEGTPIQRQASELLRKMSFEHLLTVWERALARQREDPEGAITAARSLLEAVCKHILDDANVAYAARTDLPKLYHMAAERLNIAPGQHSEELFRRILGGCTAVVEGLGALRNMLGDAHGGPRTAPRPAPRHAQLAVHLAGAVALFLFQTAEARQQSAG